MGRGVSDDVISPPRAIKKDRDGYSIIQPGVPDDIGTETHRRRLETYARARTGRRDISLTLANFCAVCQHKLEDHGYSYCSGDPSCVCEEHVPGGGSFTDMKGNITIQSDVPPQGDIGERELAMRGLLRHEVCHELYTSRDVFEKFAEESGRMRGNAQEITAATIQKYWNILEDGMIEERERHLRMGSYEYISALNRVWPRVGKDQTTKQEMQVPLPEGYIAEDADGNPLSEVRSMPTLTGEMKDMLHVPAGTRISTWGEKPLSKIQQFESALLAESVPEFSVGVLHPDVQAAFDECKPHIDAAVRGNTSDCLARAYMIHSIAKKHGLAPDDLTPEERKAIDGIRGELEEGIPTNPVPVKGQGGKGKGPKGIPKPSNGIPNGSEMSDEMKKSLENGDGEPNNNRTDTYDPSSPLPEGSREKAESEGSGKVEGEKLEEKKKEAEKELKSDGEKEKNEQASKLASGKLEADNWQIPHGNATPQREIASDVRASDGGNLMEEKPDMLTLGRQLAERLSRMEVQTRAPERRKKRGRFDQRKTSALVAYEQRVFKNKGQDLDIDMEIDVSIDRSGSVKFDAEANERQYDMAKTIGYASRFTKVPISIYGWCSGHGGVDNFAFKESHSDDLTAIDGFAFCGGGGTPTDAGIEFSRARLRHSKKRNKVMLVVTDGEANSSLTNPALNSLEAARAQVEKARAEGIQVIGIGLGVSDQSMNETFGAGGWQNIEDYREVPRIVASLIERAAAKVAGVS